MKVLVTGASGYLGSHVAETLFQSGHQVGISFRTPRPTTNLAGAELHAARAFEDWCGKFAFRLKGDLTHPKTLGEIPIDLDAIVHTVALNHKKSEESTSDALRINVGTTWNLLKQLRSKNARFLYFSTFQVYGKHAGENLTEARSPRPENAYGLTHLLSEQIVDAYSQRTSSSIKGYSLRITNGFGAPHFAFSDCWWLVLNDFCRTAFYKKRIDILSDGKAERDFIHVSDIARTALFLLETEDAPTGPYHVASGKTWTIRELARCVQSTLSVEFNLTVPVYIQGQLWQPSEDKSDTPVEKRFRCDTSKIAGLGFELNRSNTEGLKKGISEIWHFLQRNGTE